MQEPHCLTKVVTFKKWLPHIECHRETGRQPLAERMRRPSNSPVSGCLCPRSIPGDAGL